VVVVMMMNALVAIIDKDARLAGATDVTRNPAQRSMYGCDGRPAGELPTRRTVETSSVHRAMLINCRKRRFYPNSFCGNVRR